MELAVHPLRSAVADNRTSLSGRLRARRFARFERWAAQLPRPLSVLDVGGTQAFWEQRGWAGRDDVDIVTLNLKAETSRHANVHPVVGDATGMPFADGEFDLVFSNSVIEHLFTAEAQRQMADEVRRVGAAHWVQTPNFWFPMEPHFLVPGWQWLPVELRVRVLQRRAVGQMGHTPERGPAEALVREVRLLTGREMRALFPGAELIPERLGLVKSWTAARLPA